MKVFSLILVVSIVSCTFAKDNVLGISLLQKNTLRYFNAIENECRQYTMKKDSPNRKARQSSPFDWFLPIALPLVPIFCELPFHIPNFRNLLIWLSSRGPSFFCSSRQNLAQGSLHYAFQQYQTICSDSPPYFSKLHLIHSIQERGMTLATLSAMPDSSEDGNERGFGLVRELSRKEAISKGIGYFGALVALSNPSITAAVYDSDIKKDYDGFAKTYDKLDGGAFASTLGIPDLREKIISSAYGKVLEVAVGTGLNLPKYTVSRLESLDAIDLSPGMLDMATQAAANLPELSPKLTFHEMSVESLKFAESSFDTVIDTFSLCVFKDPVAALKEMGRVCKPGGRILLLENNRAENNLIGAYQDLTAPIVAEFGGKGCFYNQDVAKLVKKAGLEIVSSKKVLGGLFAVIEATKSTTLNDI